MSSVYNRLGFNFDTTNFNGADALTPGGIVMLNNSSIHLKEWQINDMKNSTVGGYYQNPHSTTLNNLITILNNIISVCNTSSNVNTMTFSVATTTPNALIEVANTTLLCISSFSIHTNNLSGVTNSSNVAQFPDLNAGLSIGRQILNITNKTDSIQNNTPILGNFTSLYVVDQLTQKYNTINTGYNTLLNTISVVSGNSTSNITDSTMNVIISGIQSAQDLMYGRMNSDIAFYTNSLAVVRDYQMVLPFSNLGATQNSLISIIGTTKLKNNLAT